MVAAEAWLAEGRLPPTRELRDAVAAMIAWSSNDATSLVVDLLTRTTSGPALPPAALARWLARRRILNRYFAGWRRPEFAGINLAQKTWYEAPYGREHQSCFAVPNNRNRLSSDAVARLLLAIAEGQAVNRRRSRAMLRLMERFPAKVDRKNPWNQVTGFLGEGLPGDARVWSKAGWSSTTRHDSAIVELADGTRFILVVMTYGAALGGQQAAAALHRAAGGRRGAEASGVADKAASRRSDNGRQASLSRRWRGLPGRGGRLEELDGDLWARSAAFAILHGLAGIFVKLGVPSLFGIARTLRV